MKALFVLVTLGLMAAAERSAADDLEAGDPAPEFALKGSDGKIHRLSDHAGKAVVLAWFPKAFTGG